MKNNKALTHIHVYELQIGMFVAKLDIPWEQSPFLLQGFEINSHADIKAVQKVSEHVYIDVSRQKQATGAIQSPSNISLSYTFSKAANAYEETSSLVKNVMDDIRFGNQLNVEVTKQAVSKCVDQVLENPDAMLLLTQLKNKDEYTSQHSLNVCVLAIILARSLNQSVEQLNQIGLCGLLHDMGKMKIPDKILNKPGKLTSQENEVMQSHTTQGRDILMSARGVLSKTVDVAYTHHERLDGEGYPRGMEATGISFDTRIISIVDCYDAITSDRIYQKGRMHLEAINILTKSRGTHLDGSLVIQFINCIGIYPVGNPVKLSNGEIGVVVEANRKNKTQPKVLKLLDIEQNAVEQVLLDLSDSSCLDQNGEPYRIVMVLHKNDCKFDLYKFYKQGGLLGSLSNH